MFVSIQNMDAPFFEKRMESYELVIFDGDTELEGITYMVRIDQGTIYLCVHGLNRLQQLSSVHNKPQICDNAIWHIRFYYSRDPVR